jgi:putative peptidoglycan lipid II flippase
MQSLAKFVVAGAVLGVALWLVSRFAGSQLSQLSTLRDEAMLLLLILVGTVVYGGSILLLFGGRWLRSLVRS